MSECSISRKRLDLKPISCWIRIPGAATLALANRWRWCDWCPTIRRCLSARGTDQRHGEAMDRCQVEPPRKAGPLVPKGNHWPACVWCGSRTVGSRRLRRSDRARRLRMAVAYHAKGSSASYDSHLNGSYDALKGRVIQHLGDGLSREIALGDA